jgi:transcriptional regulator with XRE-family HTH domain
MKIQKASADEKVLQEKFQHLLRQVRSEAGMRQVDLAAKLGRPQSFVSNYEAGERGIDIMDLRYICEAVGISLPEFVNRFEEAVKGQ